MIENFTQLFLIAFALGLVHALDADHILAVSALASDSTSVRRSLRYALRWAAGHGVMLLSIMLIWHLSGISLSAKFSALAEQAVGVVLIVLGAVLVYRIRQQHLHFHFHTHEGMLPHAHWHRHVPSKSAPTHRHEHKAYFIGGLHGLAGSAPLLALMPVVHSQQLVISILYLVLFSLGVFVAMVCFGGVFGATLQKIDQHNKKFVVVTRSLVAIMSIAAGIHLVSA